MLVVVGTSAMVLPAAGYTTEARKRVRARAAFFDLEVDGAGIARRDGEAWAFPGGASKLVPLVLGGLLGEGVGVW